MLRISVQVEDFDAAQETAALTEGRHDVGAVASFIGLVRGEGERLEALELEHYPGMAEEQLTAIAKEAQDQWPLDAVCVIHRFGKIEVGGQIVLVIATSRHREAAFDAARHIMDYLKTDAPFWKKEHPKDGQDGTWVEGI
jgi:molybdopterin synthase catalytic subunit